jgi:hypothetical protein
MTQEAPRASGAPWQPSEIRRWLANRVYLGEVRYGDLVNTEGHPPLADLKDLGAVPAGTRDPAQGPCEVSAVRPRPLRSLPIRDGRADQRRGEARHAVYRCNGRRCDEASVITADRLEGYVTDLVREHVRGLQLEAAGEGADLETLDREYEEAEAELQAFASDLNARRELGEAGWKAAFDARVRDRDEKRAARDEAYDRSKLASVSCDVDDLRGDELRDLVGGMVEHIFIRRRERRAKVDDRALIIWSDDHRVFEVPGPNRSSPFEPVRW